MSESQKIATIADRLKEALTDANMKQIDLCRLADIPRGSLSLYLSGAYEPKQDRVHRMAKALGVNEAWLLGYDVPKHRNKVQKKNDQLVELIILLGTDNEFAEMVQMLSELTPEQKDSVKQLLTVFIQK